MIRVLLAGVERLFGEGIKEILASQDDICVAGMATEGQNAIQQIQALNPDIVLIDMHMTKMDGIRATIAIKKQYPGVKVILITTFANEELVITGFLAKVDGFLLKNLDANRFIRSIRDVYDEQLVISGEAAAILAKKIMDLNYDEKEILNKRLKNRDMNLSPRELDIAYLLMKNRTNKEIAKTVKK